MTETKVWLLGNLNGHARGKVIAQVLGATPAHVLPGDPGVCIAFGSDFQDQDEEVEREWVRWSEHAGRTLLLVPPYSVGECHLPVTWRVYRPQAAETDSAKLAKLLAPEVRFEVTGRIQVATEIGGQWKGGGVNTGFYRKHPHSGVFAVTCLPLWSLTVLDHQEVLREWLSALHGLAGVPAAVEEAASGEFRPSKDHFAMLLHLCGNSFSGQDEAVESLADSPVLSLPEAAARQCLEQLEEAGWASGGGLTEEGREALFSSPYAAYAEAMERK